MTTTRSWPEALTLADFDALFESVKNWGRWGPDDELGTLNYIGPEMVRRAAALVRSGRHVTMENPLDKVAGPDNASQAIHHLVQGHDVDLGSSGLTSATDYLGIAFHGSVHSHVDALCHMAYRGLMYNGRPAREGVTSRGAAVLDVTAYRHGLVGRGILIDAPRHRGLEWLEPGQGVGRVEIEAIERAEGLRVGEGDIVVFRTGLYRRRSKLGPWSHGYPPAGQGKAGLHPDVVAWMHERRIAAFLSDGDGETIPACVEGILYPIQALEIVAMGMFTADSLQLEDLAAACSEEGRFEFLVAGAPLALPGGTGSPWNPIAIF
jgi:kynurenine formamidase